METVKQAPPLWKCPPPPRDAELPLDRIQRLANLYYTFASSCCHLTDAVGNEIIASLMLLGGEGEFSPDNPDVWIAKCRRICLSPSFEVMLFSHWDILKNFNLSETVARSLVRVFLGRDIDYRNATCVGHWRDRSVRFPEPSYARLAIGRVLEYRNRATNLAFVPLYSFAEIIMSHPFMDGNGRLARSLLHAGFSLCREVSVPSIPLGPAFALNAHGMHYALNALSSHGDWDSYISAIEIVINNAISLHQFIHKA